MSARLGVSARVQRGNLVCGGNSQSVQSKQGVSPGMMTRACPLSPSVPPSTMTLKLAGSGLPSSPYSATDAATWLLRSANRRMALQPCR